MSAQAIGILDVILPKESIKEFESYFDQNDPKSFPNAEIKLYEARDKTIDKRDFSHMGYELQCSYSVCGCLMECKDQLGYDFQEVCKKLGVREVYIDTHQAEDKFSEQILLSSEGFKYLTQDDEDENNSEVELD